MTNVHHFTTVNRIILSTAWWWGKRSMHNEPIADMIDRALAESNMDELVQGNDDAWDDVEKREEEGIREMAEEWEEDRLNGDDEAEDLFKKIRDLADMMEDE